MKKSTMRVLAAFAVLAFCFAAVQLGAQGKSQRDYIVLFERIPDQKWDAYMSDYTRMIEAHGGQIEKQFKIVPAVACRLHPREARRVQNYPFVRVVEPDHRLFPAIFPNDPLFGQLDGLHNTGQDNGTNDDDIDAPEAWDIQRTSANIKVAVIDTGMQEAHDDLDCNTDKANSFDFFEGNPGVFDSPTGDRHGTHVGGTIAACGNNGIGVTGVSWSADVVSLKFLGPGGGSTSDGIDAVQRATQLGARVINASWGGGGFSQALKDAIENCNCVFAAAAGNDGINTDINPHFPSAYDSANIISVAATNDDDQLAGFSNFGSTSVDLCAPGVSTLSTIPTDRFGRLSGTSMATPHVSGVAALVFAQDPSRTALQVKNIILNSVDAIPACANTTLTGGRLNACKALGGCGGGSPPGGGQRVVVYEEGWEASAGGWTKTNGATDLWRLSPSGQCVNSAGRTLAFNDSGTCTYNGVNADGAASSPTINASGSNCRVEVNHLYETETFAGGSFDRLFIDVSVDGGPFQEVGMFDSTDPNKSSFGVDLFPFPGGGSIAGSFRVRFRFLSVDDQFNNFLGWHIEDVKVSCEP